MFGVGQPLSWLMLLNFVVLQWFGMRLARVTYMQYTDAPDGRGLIADVVTRWSILKWILPLTGWWNRYKWVWNRSRWVGLDAHSRDLRVKEFTTKDP